MAPASVGFGTIVEGFWAIWVTASELSPVRHCIVAA